MWWLLMACVGPASETEATHTEETGESTDTEALPTGDTGETELTGDTDVTDETGDTASPEPAGWMMEEEHYDLLLALLENQEDELIEVTDLAAELQDPTLLYNVQIYTHLVLTAGRRLQDPALLDPLARIYLQAHDDLVEAEDYIYYYWPDEDYRSTHALSESAHMWLDHSGEEIILESSQFLYAVAALIGAIAELPEAERTADMLALVEAYTEVLAHDHYERWAFTSTPFQVRGWGCDAGMLTHEEYLQHRIGSTLCEDDSERYSYLNAVIDTDFFLVGGVLELVAAHRTDPDLVALDDALETDFLAYAGVGATLFLERFSETERTDFDGDPATGLAFDVGAWRDHPDLGYAGYDGATAPTAADAAMVEDITWDVSHARRFVQIFDTLQRTEELHGVAGYDEALLAGLAVEYAHGAFAGDLSAPLLNNFMDGTNGWYRADPTSPSTGYGPFGLTNALVTGGYGMWAEHQAGAGEVRDATWAMLTATVVWDQSGEGNHAALSGGTWLEEGAIDGAVVWEGDGALELSTDGLVSSEGTVELWLRFDGRESGDDILNIYENGYYDFLLVRRLSTGQIVVYIEDEDSEILYTVSEATVDADTWHHLVITQDGSALRIYIDGSDEGVTGRNSDAWTDHLSLSGASIGWSHWNTLSGAVDEVRIYERALSADEVLEHYSGLFSDETGLVVHLDLDEAIDEEVLAHLEAYYSIDLSLTDSLDLLQFVPTLIERE